ncbi:hypothetical protein AAFF_G00221790 [Aldrovandia affinis]|uniref:Uncharacterized protein n=1 Tax=Aldrovandia affinis TaxID=143900 RepID=A0AAD7RFK9_9TELE|nr:hypothetical protein AAFF_G00221790 [Aldrovandia affinis]
MMVACLIIVTLPGPFPTPPGQATETRSYTLRDEPRASGAGGRGTYPIQECLRLEAGAPGVLLLGKRGSLLILERGAARGPLRRPGERRDRRRDGEEGVEGLLAPALPPVRAPRPHGDSGPRWDGARCGGAQRRGGWEEVGSQ